MRSRLSHIHTHAYQMQDCVASEPSGPSPLDAQEQPQYDKPEQIEADLQQPLQSTLSEPEPQHAGDGTARDVASLVGSIVTKEIPALPDASRLSCDPGSTTLCQAQSEPLQQTDSLVAQDGTQIMQEASDSKDSLQLRDSVCQATEERSFPSSLPQPPQGKSCIEILSAEADGQRQGQKHCEGEAPSEFETTPASGLIASPGNPAVDCNGPAAELDSAAEPDDSSGTASEQQLYLPPQCSDAWSHSNSITVQNFHCRSSDLMNLHTKKMCPA